MVLLQSGCVEFPHEPGSPPVETFRGTPSLFESAPPAISFNRDVILEEKTYRVERIRFNPMNAHLWRPSGEGPHPAILLLPAIWGDRYMEDFARTLVAKGFVCLQLPSGRYMERIRSQGNLGLDGLAEQMRSQVYEAGRVLSWLSRQPDVDPKRIGVLGISIGAILASLLTEQDETIQAAAFILGGGNLPEIMTAPQGYVKRRLRERIMTETGMTEEEFKSAAAESFRGVDPLTYAGRLDGKRILMVNGRFDNVIPYKNARELWMAMDRPDWLVLPAGHYTASFFLTYIRHRVSEHFVRQFG